MQLHHVEEFEERLHEVDPVRGPVVRPVKKLRQGAASCISHGGVDYEISPDGTFEVPPEVGAEFLGRPGWYEGPNPLGAGEIVLPDPKLAEVEAERDELQAKLAEVAAQGKPKAKAPAA
jgi:hypothetical protein